VKRIRAVFDYVAQRQCVLLLDDIDIIGMDREAMHSTEEMKRLASALLVLLDDVPSDVIVVGGTSHPMLLDRAFLRRFHMRLDLTPPKPGIDRVLLLHECEDLTKTQRRHVALVENFFGEHVLLVVKDYDKDPDVSAARRYLRRKGCDWNRVEFCSREQLASIYEAAARSVRPSRVNKD
jgi:SpoVK/Ycf46/Vps4 family AAA+-type ATPase